MGFRNQPFAFDSPDAAIAAMLDRLDVRSVRSLRSTEAWPLTDSLGKVLAQPITADRDSPAFDHSSMDGYAVRVAELVDAFSLRAADDALTISVIGESRIGRSPPSSLESATTEPRVPRAIRIATGAPIPPGADAVIKREETVEQSDADDPQTVRTVTVRAEVVRALRPRSNTRLKGENVERGKVVLKPGQIITPAAVAVMAAVGVSQPRVYAPLRVAIITTGDELVPVDSVPSPFEIRNSNAPALLALLSSARWINVVSCTHVRDDTAPLEEAVRHALGSAEAIILTGGVSVGHRDPVRSVIETIQAEIVFHGLPQRPGKPTLGAVLRRENTLPVPIFGLPGNPNSTLVTCTRLVRPVFAAVAGLAQDHQAQLVSPTNPDAQSLDLYWHRLARRTAPGFVELLDARSSGDIVTSGQSDGVIEQPPGKANEPTAAVRFFPWSFGQ
ncbi:MAG: molybdopterin molybdotransferase MoeA [Phycisphaerales bacterium]|nr:molybdopterin molybdotransferase MoeA [Phycisphaerales bacterium]